MMAAIVPEDLEEKTRETLASTIIKPHTSMLGLTRLSSPDSEDHTDRLVPLTCRPPART